MVRSPDATGVVCWRGMALGLCLAFAIPASAAERRVTLEELGSRTKPDHDARLEGQVVTVRGVVNAPAFHFTDYHVLTIQDKSFGGVLKVPVNDKWLDGFHPGDEIEAKGKVVLQFGMVMLEPEDILVV